jgi:hypothetical protein
MRFLRSGAIWFRSSDYGGLRLIPFSKESSLTAELE